MAWRPVRNSISRGTAFSQAKYRAETEQREIFVIWDKHERSYFAQDIPASEEKGEVAIGSVKPSKKKGK